MTVPRESQAANSSSQSGIDAGLLAIRIGIGLSFVLLFALKQSEAAKIIVNQQERLLPLVSLSIAAFAVVCGFFTELAAALSALGWAWAMYSGLQSGAEWFVLPVRAAQYMILFAGLGVTGPGKYSLDHLAGKVRDARDSDSSFDAPQRGA
jgi:uncharacterized membrane protein YphA (DoxX/SURF4 family)